MPLSELAGFLSDLDTPQAPPDDTSPEPTRPILGGGGLDRAPGRTGQAPGPTDSPQPPLGRRVNVAARVEAALGWAEAPEVAGADSLIGVWRAAGSWDRDRGGRAPSPPPPPEGGESACGTLPRIGAPG